MTEDHHAPARLLLLGQEPAAERGLHAKSREQIPRYDLRTQVDWFSGAAQAQFFITVGNEMLENMIRGPKIEEVGIGQILGMRRASRASRLQRYEPVGIGKRKRPEDDSVDDAEDSSVRSDPQRECEDTGQREGRRSSKLPDRVARIRDEFLDPRPSPDVIAALFEQGEIAESAPGSVNSLLPSHPAGDQIIGHFVEVGPHLFSDVTLQSAPRK